MTIKLNIQQDVFTPKFFPMLHNYDNRFEFYMGSAGSSKSYFITQKIILKALRTERRVLVARRYGNTNRNSTFALFKQVLSSFSLLSHCKVTETDIKFVLPNNSEIIFIGLDDEQKLLSLNNISDIFVEEIFEITRDTFEQLNLRMRGNAPQQQIFAAFNPISRNHWLHDFCVVNTPESFVFIHSTYKDNPFLPQAYIDAIEELRTMNPQKFRIYGLGEWGIDSDGLVFTNWTVENFDPQELASKGYAHRVGMDLGYVDPSTIIATLYDEANRTIYVYNEYYKSGAQLDELVKGMEDMKLKRTKIYCDSAEPRSIDFFRRNSFNVIASKKGKGSVDIGIAFIQNHRLIIHPSCKELLREIENYSYIKSKKTGEYTNDTTHEFSHSLDALRYAYSDIYSQNKITTLNKAALGL